MNNLLRFNTEEFSTLYIRAADIAVLTPVDGEDKTTVVVISDGETTSFTVAGDVDEVAAAIERTGIVRLFHV